MKVYYYSSEYESGKHKIRTIIADFIGIGEVPSHISGTYPFLEFDEFYNRRLAVQLRNNDRMENDLPDRFYVNNLGQLVDNDTDEVVTINPNPQKQSYKLSQLYGLTHEQLDTYIDNNVTNLATAKEVIRKALHVILWLVKQTKLEE